MLNAFVTYEYYISNFCSSLAPLLDAENFDLYIKKAVVFLESITNKGIDASDENIKNAICAIADKLFLGESKGNIKSESADGYSVTFKDGESLRQGLFEIALMYLGKSDMLYSGVE